MEQLGHTLDLSVTWIVLVEFIIHILPNLIVPLSEFFCGLWVTQTAVAMVVLVVQAQGSVLMWARSLASSEAQLSVVSKTPIRRRGILQELFEDLLTVWYQIILEWIVSDQCCIEISVP